MLPNLIAVFTSILAAAGPADGVPSEYAKMHRVEIQIVEETNRERVRHGLEPLRIDWKLLKGQASIDPSPGLQTRCFGSSGGRLCGWCGDWCDAE